VEKGSISTNEIQLTELLQFLGYHCIRGSASSDICKTGCLIKKQDKTKYSMQQGTREKQPAERHATIFHQHQQEFFKSLGQVSTCMHQRQRASLFSAELIMFPAQG
jgi:hypothetical protein